MRGSNGKLFSSMAGACCGRGWCSASRGWAGAWAGRTRLTRPIQKRFRNQNTEGGDKMAAKERRKKRLANWVPSVPAHQTNVAVQVWAAGAASRLTDFSPTDFRKRTGKQEKSIGRTKVTPHVQAELGET